MIKNKSIHLFGPALALILAAGLVLGAVRPVYAEAGGSSGGAGGNGTTGVIDQDGKIGADEVIDDDVFLGAEQVVMDGTVNGNVMAAGNTVTINGTVNGDVIAMGQRIVIGENAAIDGNLFGGASVIEVSGAISGSIAGGSSELVLAETNRIGRNLYFGGFSLNMQPGASIERSAYIGAYQAIVNGSVADELQVSSAALELGGEVGGDVYLDVADPAAAGTAPMFMAFNPQLPPAIPAGLRIAPEAEIGGKLTYTSPVEQQEAIAAAPAGGIVYQTPVPNQTTTSGSGAPGTAVRVVPPLLKWLFDFLRNLFSLMLLGLLAVWLLPRLVNRAAEAARARTAASAGYGALVVVLGYFAAFVAAILILIVGLFFTFITLGGLSRTIFGVGLSGLALLVTLFSLLVGYGSKLVVAYLVGDLILAASAPNLTGRRYWAMVLGVVIYVLARSVPLVGWLVGLVVTIIGIGALWLLYRSWRTQAVVMVPPVTAAD